MDWLLILFGALLAVFCTAFGAVAAWAMGYQFNRERILLYRELGRLETENDALAHRAGVGIPEEEL